MSTRENIRLIARIPLLNPYVYRDKLCEHHRLIDQFALKGLISLLHKFYIAIYI